MIANPRFQEELTIFGGSVRSNFCLSLDGNKLIPTIEVSDFGNIFRFSKDISSEFRRTFILEKNKILVCASEYIGMGSPNSYYQLDLQTANCSYSWKNKTITIVSLKRLDSNLYKYGTDTGKKGILLALPAKTGLVTII